MSQSSSLYVASGDTLSTLSCKLQSAGCSVVRGVLDLLMMPSGNQRLLGWLGNHLLSVAGQLGSGASDLIPVHTGISPAAAGSFLAAIACAAILALRSMGVAATLAIVTLTAAFALTMQLSSDLIGSAKGIEFLLISGLVAVSTAFRYARH
ncbi:hypothetical protein J2848_002831 [Azospirillum lipoferum]|uniref:Uncharacterized protein n=1 Tax=Azospirillum lipoferum TaxID=193 RepID=A0A5A9GP20_AZOLI|nr:MULTISPECIES: hypothetical protein [Azospirillum]KAA0596196.1 hypothetical protein FZ942_13620 [Azospirillum lipoferum]MCP1611158.1 hypothetical protein [Azospirillum lipoferum]MDW5533717.1 hypothetical protein [Azospirillum sp. NL1]